MQASLSICRLISSSEMIAPEPTLETKFFCSFFIRSWFVHVIRDVKWDQLIQTSSNHFQITYNRSYWVKRQLWAESTK